MGVVGPEMKLGAPTPTNDTIQAALDEAATRGYHVNNLFQLGDGTWQANFRAGDSHFEFGKGRTAVAALTAALEKAAKSIPQKVAVDARQATLSGVFD
jgi:hypothetical protein